MKYRVSAASVESEPCVMGIESSNNERWSGYNFPWTKELEEFSERLYVNFFLKLEQRKVINATMSGHDVYAEMPAGMESRVTYQLPALVRPGTTVVVVRLPEIVAIRVEHPVLDKKSMGLSGLMKLTEQKRILGELVKESSECKLLYVTTGRIIKSKLLLEHLKTLYDRELLARIVIEEVESVSERYKLPHYQGLRIFKKEFPKVPLLALASIATDSIRDEAVDILGLVNCIHVKNRSIHSRVSFSEQSEPASPKCSLTKEKQNSFGPDSPDHNIVDEGSHAYWIVASSWMIEKSKIGKRQRRQTKLLEELCLLNSIYGEHFVLDYKSGIDISIPLRVLLSKDILKDERTILKINWTDTQVGIDIEPRDGVKRLSTFHGKLQSAAEQKHIEGSIKALLNAVRKTFNFGPIPIMARHIIYPRFEREYEPIKELGSGSLESCLNASSNLMTRLVLLR